MKPLPYPDNKHLEAAEGWLGLGDHLAANKELENIRPELRDHPFVLEVRYRIFAEAKRWEEAIEIARTLSELLPDNSWGFIHYAYSLHELKRTKEACGVLIPVVDKFSEATTRIESEVGKDGFDNRSAISFAAHRRITETTESQMSVYTTARNDNEIVGI